MFNCLHLSLSLFLIAVLRTKLRRILRNACAAIDGAVIGHFSYLLSVSGALTIDRLCITLIHCQRGGLFRHRRHDPLPIRQMSGPLNLGTIPLEFSRSPRVRRFKRLIRRS